MFSHPKIKTNVKYISEHTNPAQDEMHTPLQNVSFIPIDYITPDLEKEGKNITSSNSQSYNHNQ